MGAGVSRLAVLVDGFNIYHSLKDAQLADKGRQTRWLNLRALSEFYLPKFDPKATLGPIHYFSAYAFHRQYKDPTVVARHKSYISCLEATSVVVEMGGFKQRDPIQCKNPKCGRVIPGGWEEKETDVGLGVRLLDLLFQSACEGAMVISGDTDQCPAIRTARRLFPKCAVFVCFPYARETDDLKAVASAWKVIPKAAYRQLQFPNPFPGPDGKPVAMPDEWKNIPQP